MIEVSKFRLVGDIITEVFLERNADFQQHFAYQQDGLLRRTLASGLMGGDYVLAINDGRETIRGRGIDVADRNCVPVTVGVGVNRY